MMGPLDRSFGLQSMAQSGPAELRPLSTERAAEARKLAEKAFQVEAFNRQLGALQTFMSLPTVEGATSHPSTAQVRAAYGEF